MPTEEEAAIISQLNSVIADAVSGIEQFDVKDELDNEESQSRNGREVNSSQDILPQSDSHIDRMKRCKSIHSGYLL